MLTPWVPPSLLSYHPSRHHSYSCMLSYPSLRQTRMLRWVSICFSLLTTLFVDALFFGLFYPDDGSCETHFTSSSCSQKTGPITGTSICRWVSDYDYIEGGFCHLEPPSNKFNFIMVRIWHVTLESLVADQTSSVICRFRHYLRR